jgi:hypothetical protein
VRRKNRYAAQVKTAIAQHRQEHRVFPRRPSHGDAEICFGLGKVQYLGAVGEHRGTSLTGIEPSVVHFTDVRYQVGLDPSRLLRELGQATKQLVV